MLFPKIILCEYLIVTLGWQYSNTHSRKSIFLAFFSLLSSPYTAKDFATLSKDGTSQSIKFKRTH